MKKKGGKRSKIKDHSLISNKSPKIFSFQKSFYDEILANPDIPLEKKDRKLKELMKIINFHLGNTLNMLQIWNLIFQEKNFQKGTSLIRQTCIGGSLNY